MDAGSVKRRDAQIVRILAELGILQEGKDHASAEMHLHSAAAK